MKTINLLFLTVGLVTGMTSVTEGMKPLLALNLFCRASLGIMAGVSPSMVHDAYFKTEDSQSYEDSEAIEDPEEQKCSICLIDMPEGENLSCPTWQTACGHKFHCMCLNSWFRNATNHLCPYCRQPIEQDYNQFLKNEALLKAAWGGENWGIKKGLEDGANVNAVNNQGQTSLHIVVAFNCDSPHLVNVDTLLNAGASLEIKDEYGDTPLIRAITYHNVRLAQLLLTRGANRNVRTNNGKTILHLATGGGSTRMLEMLKETIDLAPFITSPDDQGKTPLHYAVRVNSEAVNILLDLGADVSIKDNDGNTPIAIARKNKEKCEDDWTGWHRSLVENLEKREQS